MKRKATPQPPQQLRSRDTVDRILDATQRQLATSGVTGLDLRAVCAAAGLTTGAVYSRFSGKEGLLDALFERFELSARVTSADYLLLIDQGKYRREPVALDDFIELLDRVYTSSGALIAALIEGSYQRPQLGRRAVAMMNEAADLLLIAIRQQGARVDRESAVAATRFAFAWFDQQVFFDRIDVPRDPDASISTLRQAMLGVLGSAA
ncbi:MAG: TetR/AcrR family transcriptional regulator [Ilumatobacteraceae bacterium]